MKCSTKQDKHKSNRKRLFTYKYDVGYNILDNQRNLTVIDRYYKEYKIKSDACISGYTNKIKKFYKIRCNICNVFYDITESNIYFRKDKCPCCSNKRVFVGYNDIATTHKDIVCYLKNKDDAKKYTSGSNKYIITKCPICKYEHKIIVYQLIKYGYKCQNCSDSISYPNKFLYCFLSQLPVTDIKYEYSSKWTLGKKYDAYFKYKGKEYLVEMDGEQHYRDVDLFKSTYKQSKQNDIIKNQLAVNNNYILIRIDCVYSNLQYIQKNILQSKFANMFNLSVIDWQKCDVFANKNIFAEIVILLKCGYSVQDISNTLYLPYTTVNRYLHIALNNNIIENYIITKDANINKQLYNKTIYRYNYRNIIQLISNHKRIHPQDTLLDIAKIYNINPCTLIYIVKRCIKNGSITYDIDKDKTINIRRAHDKLVAQRRKRVYAYNSDLKYIGEFACATDAVYSNQNTYGWTVKGIQKVCTKYQKHHRGCIFSYEPLQT